MPRQKSINYKETDVNYNLVEDKTQEEVCQILNCSRRSLMRWVQKYQNEGKITGYERTCFFFIETNKEEQNNYYRRFTLFIGK